ncbi:MAG: beta-ketoacyl-ACP reductase [Nitrospira bacterium HGW-Nitrospira-1]|nr:MAG: beta-ketoacyl-ACP reductase [Nitrospira bacterium HGW-Nitrospira-1]
MPVALITGASRGLGKQTALALSAHGYSVAVNYVSSHKEAANLVKTLLKTMGNSSIAFKADVGDITQVRAMAEEIQKTFGKLDVIINNAGITKDNLLLKQTEDEWDSIIRTNLKGCFNIISALSPLMIQSGGGNIINISSYSGMKGKAGQSAYSASKAAILGLTVSAAQELSRYNIRVNAILPGYMMTEMGLKAQKAAEKAKDESILKKLSEPKDAADFIVYLATTKNISGQVFSLDSRIG